MKYERGRGERRERGRMDERWTREKQRGRIAKSCTGRM